MGDIKAQVRTSPLYHWNYESKARVKINQGGTSSGKTYAILQVIFMRLIKSRKIATIVGQDLPNLKKGAIRDLIERILVGSPWMNNFIIRFNISTSTLHFKNGSKMEFTSFKDAQDARSGKRDIAFFNEANGISFAVYEQVVMRTTGEIFIDYNPSEEFWVHERLKGEDGVEMLYSNFSHNPYVHQSVVGYLFSLKERDENAWKVYGLGKTGMITELVHPKIYLVDEMPQRLKKRGYGMDFGYTVDPTTLIDCGLMNENDVYLDEIIHGYGMGRKKINNEMIEKGVKRNQVIGADLAEQRLIDDLAAYKWKIYGVDKGPGSIKYGNDLLGDYKLHVTRRSLNIIAEQKKYKRKVNKKTGEIMEETVDAWNHCWDAIRYWAMDNLKPLTKRKGVRRGN